MLVNPTSFFSLIFFSVFKGIKLGGKMTFSTKKHKFKNGATATCAFLNTLYDKIGNSRDKIRIFMLSPSF
jgi:hypothetical protein